MSRSGDDGRGAASRPVDTSRLQSVNAVLAAIAVILLVAVLAAYNREQLVEAQDHVSCLAEFGGGAPGSQEYIECRRARDARMGRTLAR